MFEGVGIASDESAPRSSKYVGLRFQITLVYWLAFEPVDHWESRRFDQSYPFQRRQVVTDIVHVPLKTGSETLRVMDKQIERLGLTRLDIKSGTGDGGGENEGVGGIHSLLEYSEPTYIRRRCFGHLPWRVADQGLIAIPHWKATQSVCTYLRDGITWSRLQAIATQGHHDGGLGFFRSGSQAAASFFDLAPPSIIEDRPETAYLFLRWLLPRHEKLLTLAARDFEQRQLDPATSGAVLATLGDRGHYLRRHVDMIMLSKGLYLWYATQKQPFLLLQGDFAGVLEKAHNVITSKAIDKYVLESLGCSEEKADRLAADRRGALYF